MRFFAIVVVAAFITTGCISDRALPYRDPKLPIERRVQDLLLRMTSEEKAVVLRGEAAPRLGIPAIHVAPVTSGSNTLAVAATWNPDLAAQEARAIAQAALEKGVDQLIIPDPRGYGEDPYLASRMTVAYVGAVQGEGLIATLPDFDTRPDPRVLQEIYYPPYRAAIEEAGIWSIKLAPGSDREALAEVLNLNWGFKGFIAGERDGHDDRLHRILRAMFASGIFERGSAVLSTGYKAAEHAIAAQSMVLLKNDGALLPIDQSKLHSIAVIGSENGIRERALTHFQTRYASGSPVTEAVDLARSSDIAIVTARNPADDELIQAVVRANRYTVVVASAAAPASLRKWADKVPVILYTWANGPEVAAALFGDISPSGRLPFTIPRNEPRSPATGGEGIYVGYRYFDKQRLDPLFPFGYGQGYTTFTWSDLRILPATPRYGQLVEAVVRLQNPGSRTAAEVVQVYVHQVKSSLDRPVKELKAFRRVELGPGETRDVSFQLDRRAMWFYDPAVQDWAVEPGIFEVLAGASSRDIRLKGTFELFQ